MIGINKLKHCNKEFILSHYSIFLLFATVASFLIGTASVVQRKKKEKISEQLETFIFVKLSQNLRQLTH